MRKTIEKMMTINVPAIITRVCNPELSGYNPLHTIVIRSATSATSKMIAAIAALLRFVRTSNPLIKYSRSITAPIIVETTAWEVVSPKNSCRKLVTISASPNSIIRKEAIFNPVGIFFVCVCVCIFIQLLLICSLAATLIS